MTLAPTLASDHLHLGTGMTTPRLRNRSSASTQPVLAPPTTRSRKTSSIAITVEPPLPSSRRAAVKPLWNSAKINVPGAAAETSTAGGSRPSSALGQHQPTAQAKRALSRPSSSAGLRPSGGVNGQGEGSVDERIRRDNETRTEPIQVGPPSPLSRSLKLALKHPIDSRTCASDPLH